MYEYIVNKNPKTQLYKNTYNKFINVYLKFVNKFQYISINFDLSIINNRDDIRHLLYELIKFSKDSYEHCYQCKNCEMTNNINLYRDIEDTVILQCDYCKKYGSYSKENVTPIINIDSIHFDNVKSYRINPENNSIVLFIVECIN